VSALRRGPAAPVDHDRLRLDELASISELAHTLSIEQWDHPSLCEGWLVRDVISHMCLGYTMSVPMTLVKIARRRFDVAAASRDESIAFGHTHTPAEILEVFDPIWRNGIRHGISRLIKPSEGLVDHVIHHQDLRRPLGLPREIPADRLVAALDVLPGLGGFVGAARRCDGLRLVALDVEWSAGDGPEVRGRGEAILLAGSGRSVALGELEGDGVDVLRSRLAA